MWGMEADIEQLKQIAEKALQKKGFKHVELSHWHFDDGVPTQPFLVKRRPCYVLRFKNLAVPSGVAIDDGAASVLVEVDAATEKPKVKIGLM